MCRQLWIRRREGERGWEEREESVGERREEREERVGGEGKDLISKVVKYTNVAFRTDKSVLFIEVSL